MWYHNRNRVLEVGSETSTINQESELYQSVNWLGYTRKRVTRQEKEILQHLTTSLYVQFVRLPRIILHASMYHLNLSPWTYTPPHDSLSTNPHHVIQHPNTSDHFVITSNYTASTTPHFPHFPPPSSQCLHLSVTPVPCIHANAFLSIIPTDPS